MTGLLVCLVVSCGAATQARLVFCSEEDNDLFQIVSAAGLEVERYDHPAEAVAAAPVGGGVLILARGYPEEATQVDARIFEQAARKQLRLFVEYPAFLPGLEIGPPAGSSVERAVITSDLFGDRLQPLRIASIHGLRYLPVDVGAAHVVAARVAGFDEALYGLPAETVPLLFEAPGQDLLVATTNLSGFVTGRYAPQDAWSGIWRAILHWTAPGVDLPELAWTPAVRASYGPDEELPADVELEAFRRGLAWFRNAKMIVHPSFAEEIAQGERLRSLPADAPVGDGSLGSLEAVLSILHSDGTQSIGSVRRGDCICETAMALAFEGRVLDAERSRSTARNLLDYYFFESGALERERGDPQDGNHGLIAWGVSSPAWWVASYGDDNARQMLGALAVAALNGDDRWDEVVLRCLFANLRTTGRLGFRGNRIDVGPLSARGWRSYFDDRPVNYAPHFEAYLWACFLWAYEQTGEELFLDRARTALTMTMAQHTDGWRWTNGLAQERARILLPLAWLVRVEDTPEHRALLRQAVDGLLALQEEHGAIREELGLPGRGAYPPPQSNEAYGRSEASLIARNGDPVSDLLYTTNFAFLGLHEAAAATGDAEMRAAADELAEFLCRIQVRSEGLPMLDGGWFRAFDFGRWEHWGSNADHGWGAWAIESGWTQGWITSVLALRQLNTSLWDLTHGSGIERHHERLRAEMLPPYVPPEPLPHDALGKRVRYQSAPDPRYPDELGDLTDGQLGVVHHAHTGWVGWLGVDAVVTVDLETERRITHLDASCLRALAVGIHLPRRVTYLISADGESFHEVAQVERPQGTARGENAALRFAASGLDARARYVRVLAQGEETIPDGFRAAGSQAWLFLDEILVNPQDDD